MFWMSGSLVLLEVSFYESLRNSVRMAYIIGHLYAWLPFDLRNLGQQRSRGGHVGD